jgi:cysteinyl-tRNA synthetase
MAPLRERFFAALADDFNTAEALGAVWEWVRESNRRGGVGDADLREMLGVLGLDNLLEAAGGDGEPDDDARELLQRREQARAARDWAEADRLRDELSARGWQVRDSPAGPELVPAER